MRQMQTGRQFGIARQRYGLSLRAVAKCLSIAPLTLQRWEVSRVPVAPDRAAHWQGALEIALANRAMDLAAHGYTSRDFGPSTDLGRALALATSRIGGAP